MNKTTWLIIITTVVIIGGGIFLFSKNLGVTTSSNLPLPSKPEYYWQTGCSHCENVDNFISNWDKKDQLEMDKFEINNKNYSQNMIARATYCKINPKDVGTPLLFTPEGKCLIGDTLIIDYLNNLYK